ncbi:hypothetical protein NDU88_004852 [Pleurodeles waltl]|uniref:Uncharacterized protein n=1 Tax=Pleurodeles waltl TaxID=8319 RepID=A0AAV7T9Y4_PLEWA|nr:hypothetical protein NDU88_004852 [Pleurodeles waltl]
MEIWTPRLSRVPKMWCGGSRLPAYGLGLPRHPKVLVKETHISPRSNASHLLCLANFLVAPWACSLKRPLVSETSSTRERRPLFGRQRMRVIERCMHYENENARLEEDIQHVISRAAVGEAIHARLVSEYQHLQLEKTSLAPCQNVNDDLKEDLEELEHTLWRSRRESQRIEQEVQRQEQANRELSHTIHLSKKEVFAKRQEVRVEKQRLLELKVLMVAREEAHGADFGAVLSDYLTQTLAQLVIIPFWLVGSLNKYVTLDIMIDGT